MFDLFDIGLQLEITFDQGHVLIVFVLQVVGISNKLIEVRDCFVLGVFKFKHGVFDGRLLCQIIRVHFKKHLLNIRYTNRLNMKFFVVFNLKFQLEKTVQLLPKQERFFA